MALPRYQNIGVAAGAGVGPIDFPNRGEATRGFDALSTAMNTMSEAFFGEARTAATEEGKKYGAEMAPTQEQIKLAMETGQPIAPVGDSRTYFGKAAQSTAAQIGAINVEARAKMDLTEIEKGIKSGAIGINEIVPKVNALTQGYSQALSQFDPVMAKRLEAELAKDGNTLFLAASSRAAAAAAAAAKRDTEAIIKHKIDFLPNVIAAGDTSFVDFESGKTVTRSMNDAVNNEVAIIRQHISKLKPEEQDRYWAQFYKKTAEGVESYVKSKSIENQDPAAIRSELESGKFDAMLNNDKLVRSSLVEWTRSYERQLENDRKIALKSDATRFENNLNGTVEALYDGRNNVNIAGITEAEAVRLLGDKAPEAMKALQDAVDFNNRRRALALASPLEQQQAIADAEARVDSATGEEYSRRKMEAGRTRDAVAAIRKSIEDDPVQYIRNNSPQVDQSFNNMFAVINDATSTPEQRKAAVAEYTSLAISMQNAVGVPTYKTRVLPEGIVNMLAAPFNDPTLTGQATVRELQRQADIWGDAWPTVLRQLSNKMSNTINVAAGMTSSKQQIAAEKLIDASKPGIKKLVDDNLASEDKKDISTTLDSSLTEFNRSLDHVLGGIANKDNYRKAIEQLAAYYVVNDGVPAKEAAQKAKAEVIDMSYNFVATSRNVARIPFTDPVSKAGITKLDNISFNISMLERYPERFNFMIPNSYSNYTPDEVRAQFYEDIKYYGRVVTNSDQTGVNLYNSAGGIVRNADGSDFTLTWADLQRPVAQTQSEVEQFLQKKRAVSRPPMR